MGRTVSKQIYYLQLVLTDTSTPMVLTSKDNEIFAALPGRPVNDPTWDATTKGVVAAMRRAEMRLHFSKKRDRRGPFKTIASGVSYGGGQKVRKLPVQLTLSLTVVYRGQGISN